MRIHHSRIFVTLALPLLLACVSAALASEKILHTFVTGKDGAIPETGVISDGAGNLYGTAFLGGVDNQGVIFKLAPTASGPWKESILYHSPAAEMAAIPWVSPLTPLAISTASRKTVAVQRTDFPAAKALAAARSSGFPPAAPADGPSTCFMPSRESMTAKVPSVSQPTLRATSS